MNTTKEYDFVLRFRLPKDMTKPEQLLSLLQEKCSDATIGIGKKGFISLDFTRSAQSFEQAVLSATQDVRKTIIGAVLVD